MKRMKRARRFCSLDQDGIYFSKDGNYAIVKIKEVCFPALLIGPERTSLIEVLKMFNSLMPIKKVFLSFGLNLKKCIEDNYETTLRVMRERCQKEVERVKSTACTSKKNITDWNFISRGAGKNPPKELQELLENTIRELEKAEIRDNRSCRKRKKPERKWNL